jgi:hypothetical protein
MFNLRNIPLIQSSTSMTLQASSLQYRDAQTRQDVVTISPQGDIKTNGSIAPMTDSAGSLGAADRKWNTVYANELQIGGTQCRILSGSGSPEGVVSAPVGSIYTRSDGGPGSTLYVKESGDGATGWVAK